MGPNSGPPASTARYLDYNQGFTNLAFFPVTFSAGLGSRAEVFGSLRTVTRIDRDIRPLFVPSNVENGGVLNGYPFVRESWTGNDLGDFIVGAKINLASQLRNAPVAFAVRTMFKLPTADADTGAGTGQLDYMLDGVFSGKAGDGELRLCRHGVARRPRRGPPLRQSALGSRSGLRRAQQVPG